MTALRDTLLYTVSLQKLDLQLVARLIISLSPHAWFIMSILMLLNLLSPHAAGADVLRYPFPHAQTS